MFSLLKTLRNLVVEVKSGKNGSGVLNQMLNMAQYVEKQIVLYVPKLGGTAVRNLEENGLLVFREIEDLLEYIESIL